MDPMMEVFEKAKNNPKMRRKLKLKAAYSVVLFIAFLGVIFITIGTIITAKHGMFLGMTHLDFLKLRANYGLIMMTLIIIHLAMNWKIFAREFKFLGGK